MIDEEDATDKNIIRLPNLYQMFNILNDRSRYILICIKNKGRGGAAQELVPSISR